MDTKENLHANHRSRMIEKFSNNPNSFSEHELLEMLLYPLIPRKNTNDIAHRLLKTFGSIKNVLSASPKELASVNGVGVKTASSLTLYGKIFESISETAKKPPLSMGFSYESNLKEILENFIGLKVELFVLYLLDKNYKVINKISYQSNRADEVDGNVSEIVKAIAINNPTYAIMCHNHPFGKAQPSINDDTSTVKMNLLCSLHGVTLLDHVIVGRDFSSYSYHTTGKMIDIKNSYEINSLVKNKMEEEYE